MASSHGAFGLLTQEFPLVHLNFQAHEGKALSSQSPATCPEPNTIPVYPLKPCLLPSGTGEDGFQAAVAMCVVQRTLFGPIAGLPGKGKGCKELLLQKEAEVQAVPPHPRTGREGDQMVWSPSVQRPIKTFTVFQ